MYLFYNFLYYDILLFLDPAPPSGGDFHQAELVQRPLLFLIAHSSIIYYSMMYCYSKILHHPVVVTFIQQSWSNSKSIFLASFFT
jgi:hypothetical protein